VVGCGVKKRFGQFQCPSTVQVLRLKGVAIIRTIKVISLKGVAIIRIARVIATSLAISVATTSFILLLLVLLFDFAISSIMQINA